MPEIVFKLICMGLGLGAVWLAVTKTRAALVSGVFEGRRGSYRRDRSPVLFWASIVASVVIALCGLVLAWAGWRWPARIF